MLKRALLLVMLALAVGRPAGAQEAGSTAADWVPADVAGLLRLNLEDPAASLAVLNLAGAVAAELQPVRVRLEQALSLDDLLPLSAWLDVEGLVVARDVLPWLAGEAAVAYADFDAGWQTEAALLVLPAADPFGAAARLAAMVAAQDVIVREDYRGTRLYTGDRLTLALAGSALLAGPADLVRAAVDARAGARPRLADSPAYQAVQADSPEAALSGYVAGSHLAPALNGLLSGDAATLPLLQALGATLAERRGAASLEARLLAGGFDAAGLALSLNAETSTLEAVVLLRATEAIAAEPARGGETLLDYIPRHAALVHRGADAAALAQDTLAVLPLSNFAGQLLGGLPVLTAGDASPLVTIPTADDMQAAIGGFQAALASAGVDLNGLLDHLAGDYALALLPRPNDPLPGLGAPFDLLLAAAVKPDAGQAALETAAGLLQALFRLERLETDDPSRIALGRSPDGPTIFDARLDGDTLLIATGQAGDRALAAAVGDNRLTAHAPWAALNQPDRADWYLDAAAFFNMFFPTPGGASLDPARRLRVALWARPEAGDGYRLTLRALLPRNP